MSQFVILLCGFISGAALGTWAGMVWDTTRLQLTKDLHKREMDEIFEEVKRLRAQVALHIGKE